MAKLSIDAEIALHHFSVRYRAGLAQKRKISEKSLSTVRDAVREQYEQEQEAKREQAPEPPSSANDRQIEDPDEGR